MKSPYVGAYWKARQETRDQCARRVSEFMIAAASIDDSLKEWFLKGARKESRKKADISKEGISRLMRTNNRDSTGVPIIDLGLNIAVWNGENASFSATIGSFSPWIENVALLEFRGECALKESQWRRLIKAAVDSFQPDSALIASNDCDRPFKDAAWSSYSTSTKSLRTVIE